VKELLTFSEAERDWLSMINTSTKMLTSIPAAERAEYESLYRSPLAIMRTLLLAGKTQLAATAMKHFRNYKYGRQCFAETRIRLLMARAAVPRWA
jgi:hypothetical protein